MSIPRRALSFLLIPALFATPSLAFTFSDSFTSAPSPLWSNLRGNWFGHDGVYDAASPTNQPPTHTSLPYSLADLTLDVDVNSVSDGGIWLHSDAGAHNGILLVTGGGGWGPSGGPGGNALYFHSVHNDSYSGQLASVPLGVPTGSNVHLRVTITGDTYSVYLNGSATPATFYTTPDFPTGRVGLYDFSTIQTFDNFTLSGHLPGDTLPYDDVIDLSDLNNVLNNFGTPNPQGLAWPKTTGTVDLNDLNMVLNNFGNHAPAPSALVTIPEPSSAFLLTTGYWLLTPSRRRR